MPKLGRRCKVTLIDMQGVGKHYGPVEALTYLDLQVREGEVVAFLGPNTVLSIMLGYNLRKNRSGFRCLKYVIAYPWYLVHFSAV